MTQVRSGTLKDGTRWVKTVSKPHYAASDLVDRLLRIYDTGALVKPSVIEWERRFNIGIPWPLVSMAIRHEDNKITLTLKVRPE